MGSHVPGPWFTPDGVSIRVKKDGRAVAVVCTMRGAYQDSDNARTLAAAADFYEAAELMISTEQSGGDLWWKGFDMLKAAFKKSGGVFPSMDEPPEDFVHEVKRDKSRCAAIGKDGASRHCMRGKGHGPDGALCYQHSVMFYEQQSR